MIWRWLTSIKTVVMLGTVLLGLFLWGSFLFPTSEEFSTINSTSLFHWLEGASFWVSWWLWASVVIVGLMALSALCCIIDSLRRISSWKSLFTRLSTEAMHLGFCLIMFGHFIGAQSAYHRFYFLPQGAQFIYPDGHVIKFQRLDYSFKGAIPVKIQALFVSDTGDKIVIGPNKPYFYKGTGLYLKQSRDPVVMVELSYEPGAIWALTGGIFFIAGSILTFVFRLRNRDIS